MNVASLPVGYSNNLIKSPIDRIGQGLTDLGTAICDRLLREPDIVNPAVPNTFARALDPKIAVSAYYRKHMEALQERLADSRTTIPHLGPKAKIWSVVGKAVSYPYLIVMAGAVIGFFAIPFGIQIGTGLNGLDAIPLFGSISETIFEYIPVLQFSAPQLTAGIAQACILVPAVTVDELGERGIRGTAKLAENSLKNYQAGLRSIAAYLESAGSSANSLKVDEITAMKLAAFQCAMNLYLNIIIAVNRKDLAEGVALELLTSYSRSESAQKFNKIREKLYNAIDENAGPSPYNVIFVDGRVDLLLEQQNQIAALVNSLESWIQANPRSPDLDPGHYEVLRNTVARLAQIRSELQDLQTIYSNRAIQPNEYKRLAHRVSRLMGNLNTTITQLDATVLETLRVRNPAALNALLAIPPGGALAGGVNFFFAQGTPTNEELAALLNSASIMFKSPALNDPSIKGRLQRMFADGIYGHDPNLTNQAGRTLPDSAFSELNNYLLFLHEGIASLAASVVNASTSPAEFAAKLREVSKSLEPLLDTRGQANGLTRFGNAVLVSIAGFVGRADQSAILNPIGSLRGLGEALIPKKQNVRAA